MIKINIEKKWEQKQQEWFKERNKAGFDLFLEEFNIKNDLLKKTVGKECVDLFINHGVFADFYFDSSIYEGSGDFQIKQGEKRKRLERFLDKFARYWSRVYARKFGLNDIPSLEKPEDDLLQDFRVNILKYDVYNRPIKDVVLYCKRIMKNRTLEIWGKEKKLSNKDKEKLKQAKILDSKGKYGESDILRDEIFSKKPLSLERKIKKNDGEVTLADLVISKDVFSERINKEVDIMRVVKTLNPKDQKLVALLIKEFSQKEIAEKIKKNKGAIKTQLCRIRKKIKNEM